MGGLRIMTKYCTTCGTKMTKKVTPLGRYDENTGKREIGIEFSCSNYRLWRIGHYSYVICTYSHLKAFEDETE